MMEHSTAYSSMALSVWLAASGAGLVHSSESCVHQANRTIGHRFADVNRSRHLSQFLANETEVGNGFAERLALPGIGDRVVRESYASRLRTWRRA
jgi:hypothetical protein